MWRIGYDGYDGYDTPCEDPCDSPPRTRAVWPRGVIAAFAPPSGLMASPVASPPVAALAPQLLRRPGWWPRPVASPTPPLLNFTRGLVITIPPPHRLSLFPIIAPSVAPWFHLSKYFLGRKGMYQIINLRTGEFQIVTLDEAAALAQLDPNEVAWAIEESGVCETDEYQITRVDELPAAGRGALLGTAAAPEALSATVESGDDTKPHEHGSCGDCGDCGEGDFHVALPVFVYISQAEFEAHLAQRPADVIRLKWDEPIVREAVEADLAGVAAKLGFQGMDGELPPEPSAVYHLTREEIALVR
jgi:hypothetical protein